MLSVDIREITEIMISPWERGAFGVAYTTRDGRQGAEVIGSKSGAEAMVRRVAMSLKMAADEFGVMPRDIAAS
jgi:hypothetical protein